MAGENRATRLASIKCAGGLAFDLYKQTCDWKTNVKNCDQIESKPHKKKISILLVSKVILPKLYYILHMLYQNLSIRKRLLQPT